LLTIWSGPEAPKLSGSKLFYGVLIGQIDDNSTLPVSMLSDYSVYRQTNQHIAEAWNAFM
jgi:hypothetical protein